MGPPGLTAIDNTCFALLPGVRKAVDAAFLPDSTRAIRHRLCGAPCDWTKSNPVDEGSIADNQVPRSKPVLHTVARVP